jgi:hypothetical protein
MTTDVSALQLLDSEEDTDASGACVFTLWEYESWSHEDA